MIQWGKKIAANIVLAALVLSIMTGMYAIAPNQAHAATPTVGVVDFGLLVNQHPDTQKANETIKTESEAAKKEFETKSADLGDKEKQDLSIQLTRKLDQKGQELLKAIAGKINAAVKEVANAKGLTIVVQKTSVVYGGLDITDEVMKKLR